MNPRSPAARLLAEHGVSAADIAKRTGRTRQAVSWHLSGGSSGFPGWLWDAIVDLVDEAHADDNMRWTMLSGDAVADAVAAAAYESREERKHG